MEYEVLIETINPCGGDRHFFLKHLDLEDGGDDFTLRGIRKIWECNR